MSNQSHKQGNDKTVCVIKYNDTFYQDQYDLELLYREYWKHENDSSILLGNHSVLKVRSIVFPTSFEVMVRDPFCDDILFHTTSLSMMGKIGKNVPKPIKPCTVCYPSTKT